MIPARHDLGPLLDVFGLSVSMGPPGTGRRRVVEGVGLSVRRGRTLAVVGESGSGKTVTALSLLRLLPAGGSSIDSGRATFHDRGTSVDLLSLTPRALRRVRGGRIAMIFQEPMTSLNPVFTIGEQIAESASLHRGMGPREAGDAASAALERVGIPASRKRAYPHEFSGGMRQRAMIAMALAGGPSLILADEPTTALDVTVQAQVLRLLGSLREEEGLGLVLITHDLRLVHGHADEVCVMYAGRVVEYGPTREVFESPLHPYTRALIRCVPDATRRAERLETIGDAMSSPGSFRIDGARVGGPAVAWWPGHAPPAGVDARSPAVFVRVGAGERWVTAWGTEGVPRDPGPGHGSMAVTPAIAAGATP